MTKKDARPFLVDEAAECTILTFAPTRVCAVGLRSSTIILF